MEKYMTQENFTFAPVLHIDSKMVSRKISKQTSFMPFRKLFRDVFRTLLYIYDGTFLLQ